MNLNIWEYAQTSLHSFHLTNRIQTTFKHPVKHESAHNRPPCQTGEVSRQLRIFATPSCAAPRAPRLMRRQTPQLQTTGLQTAQHQPPPPKMRKRSSATSAGSTDNGGHRCVKCVALPLLPLFTPALPPSRSQPRSRRRCSDQLPTSADDRRLPSPAAVAVVRRLQSLEDSVDWQLMRGSWKWQQRGWVWLGTHGAHTQQKQQHQQ